MTNPLLDFSGLPRFEEIKNEHITLAVEKLLDESRAVIDKARNDAMEPTWQNFVQPMADTTERLSRAWGQVSHLNAVMNSSELREVYNANLPKITQFYAELGQDQQLFEKFKQLRNSQEFGQLSSERKKIVENELRDFRLGGAELSEEKKARFLEIQEALSALSSKFGDNLLDSTNKFSLVVENSDELTGIPEDAIQAAQEAAKNDATLNNGWKFTLQMPSYLPVLQYADNRVLREKMYRAFTTRASELNCEDPSQVNDGEWDNAPLINSILKLCEEEAHMLGFSCYAEVSLATKMASTPKQVLAFLGELAAKARPHAESDFKELQVFAAEKLNLESLEAWDLAYVSEKLREARYAFSDQEVKQYFPETKVLPGMFKLVENLYCIKITQANVSDKVQCWHPDVKLFDISDLTGKLIGQFYLDLYARSTKRGGAWMDSAITRRRIGSETSAIQTPVAYLNCNFSAPVSIEGKLRPALFTHNEVNVLFHEFGHGLHHLLTQIEDLGVSGINGVEWDAVELPSQFMENFCWEWDVLTDMTQHIDSGESLPRALFDKMLAAKNFQSGLQMLRQIEFALFDMHLYYDFDPAGDKTVLQLMDEIRQQVAVVVPPAYNRFANSFAHIFAGGYAAGYYSYKWAEVLSADAYSMFEESGVGNVVNADTGSRFWKEILSVGGSRPALESFIAFRGREPSIDALLRHNGIST